MRDPVVSRAFGAIRPEAANSPNSGIMETRKYGGNRPGLIPLWVGEGDTPTASFICDAGARSLAAGETYYTWQHGIPELREALARYHARLFSRPFAPERFYVTVGGMHALQTAVRIVAGLGDEVLIPTPAWPNFAGALSVAGASVVGVPLSQGHEGWFLDPERLAAAITPKTRAIVINSPANPTGWTARPDDIRAILDLARRHGLWIIADEIYQRFAYDERLMTREGRTPSFHDAMSEDDRILFVQTFSKNWAMTGWRIGWLEAPPHLGQIIENLIQYSTSGVPIFHQRAAIAALEEGEGVVAEQVARAKRGRDIVCQGLAATNAVELPPPPGAFYAFFRVRGITDSAALARRLIDDANVGLAPGWTFGEGGEGYMRLCFARGAADLEEAVRRLAPVIRRLAGEAEAGQDEVPAA